MAQSFVQSIRFCSHRILILTLCMLMLGVSSAQAAGFWLLDQGASNFARGGANIVDPGDPTAVYLNPAGLAGLSGFQFVAGGNMIFDSRSFLRAPELDSSEVDYFHYMEGREYEQVSNEASPVPSPNLFAAYNFESHGLPGLTMGLGLWGPPRADLQLDEEGPQRYSTINSYNIQAHYGLSAAYEFPWQKLRLGVTLMGITQKVDTKLKLNVPLVAGNIVEDPDKDIGVSIKTTQHAIPSAVLGVSLELTEGLSLAMSYQLPFKVHGIGMADLSAGKDLDVVDFEGDAVEVQLDMPAIIRSALRYTAQSWDVELAFVYETWSVQQTIDFDASQIQVKAENFNIDQPVGELPLLPHWRDTYSVRLGSSFVVVPDLVVGRAGVFYEPAAIDQEWLNIGNFDLDKVGATVGARVVLSDDFWMDVATGYVHYMPVEVTESATQFKDPLEEGPPTGHAIGNGSYDSQQIVIMMALGMSF